MKALNAVEAIRRQRDVPPLSNATVVLFGIGTQFAMGDAQAQLADVNLVSTHELDHRDARRMVKADIALGAMSVCISLDADQLVSDPIRQRAII